MLLEDTVTNTFKRGNRHVSVLSQYAVTRISSATAKAGRQCSFAENKYVSRDLVKCSSRLSFQPAATVV